MKTLDVIDKKYLVRRCSERLGMAETVCLEMILNINIFVAIKMAK